MVKLPVTVVQVGCVTAPAVGAVGVAGCALIIATVAVETHPVAFLTVTL